MKINNLLLSFFLFSICLIGYSQVKKPLDHSVYETWKLLSNTQVSNNGKFISYEINPQKGDGWLYLYNIDKNRLDSFQRGYEARFSGSSNYFVFKVKPQYDTNRKLKLAKTKKEKMPADTLVILVLNKDTLIRIPRVKSYKMPEENSNWMAYLLEKELKDDKKPTKDTAKAKQPDTLKTEKPSKPKEKAKKEKEQLGTHLVIFNPVTDSNLKYKNCDEYTFSRKGGTVFLSTIKKDSIDSTAIYIVNTQRSFTRQLDYSRGIFKNLKTDEAGNQAVYLFSGDTTEKKIFSLYFWNEKSKSPEKIADTVTKEIPAGWAVSENGNLYFSEDGNKVYFGTAPKPVQDKKDTLLDEEKARVDIWNWKDDRLQSQQLKELKDDLKKSYLAVIDLKSKTTYQLADETVENIMTIQKGNANIALGYSDLKYRRASSWEGFEKNDVYLIDMKKKTRIPVLIKCNSSFSMSPGGNYIIWYEKGDSSWYCRSVAGNKTVSLTKSLKFNFYNEETDVPDLPGPYGYAGWTDNDKYVLIYDKYDIWQIDPAGKEKAVCLTGNYGRNHQITLRYIRLDRDAQFISSKTPILLKGVNELTKDEMFISQEMNSQSGMKVLFSGPFRLTSPVKSKNGDVVIWRKSSVSIYPDLWFSKTDFSFPKKISVTNPQQSKYIWATVEPVNWVSLNGEKLNGLLYKPENFDPAKKYPMIVYFYEKYSDDIHNHYIPQPSYSVVNFTLYPSNGYLVFIPDITYETGYPGKSAFNAIISGTLAMCEHPWVDKSRLGLQGQSWGGYQVAYLVTQTNLFTAAMAGAPVSNMTSAYGGIRWESGMVRTFQYETGQSRIGATLWDKPSLYLENSPLFYADKIKTPLLIMSNDNDGAVPWYQGLEFFNALRRLDKPAWLLCYNGDEHNLTRWPNRVDLSIRMLQFFDHFLKGQQAPEWMEKGIPAIEKGKTNGYELNVK